MHEFPLPPIEKIDRFWVVRDDLLPGGTKSRYLLPLLERSSSAEFVYASSAYGYAQVSLAHVARLLGKRATIFTAKRATLHPRTLEAQAAGAKIVLVKFGRLNVVQARATAYCAETGAHLVPFGVDEPIAIAGFTAVVRSLGLNPPEVWSVAGSGTLTRALQSAWPAAQFHAVQIGAHPNMGRAWHYRAPERFEEEALKPPPFPSCSNYDAKAWQFLSKIGREGALFWNVAA